jgi:hypothetical protein
VVPFVAYLAAASDEVYQLLAHGRWFSPGTPASSTSKTGRRGIAESGVKHINKINQIKSPIWCFKQRPTSTSVNVCVALYATNGTTSYVYI